MIWILNINIQKISKELFFDIPNNILLLFLNYLKNVNRKNHLQKINIYIVI